MLSTQSVNMRQMWPQSAPCVNIVEVHSSFAHAANEAEIITSGTLSVRGNTALHWQCQPRNLETETVEKPMNLRATQAVCVPTFLLIFKVLDIFKFQIDFYWTLGVSTVTRTVHDTDLSVAEAGMEEGCPRSPPECPVVVVPA